MFDTIDISIHVIVDCDVNHPCLDLIRHCLSMDYRRNFEKVGETEEVELELNYAEKSEYGLWSC